MSLKDKVTLIHQKLKKLGYEVKRTHCQEVLAIIEDSKNWHVLKSKETQKIPKKEIKLYTTLCNNFVTTNDIDPINAMAILNIKDTELFYSFVLELDQMLKDSKFNSLSINLPKYVDYNLYDCYTDELIHNPNGIFHEEYNQDYKENQEFSIFDFKISKVLGDIHNGNELEFVFIDDDIFVVLAFPVPLLLDLLSKPKENNEENLKTQYFCLNYCAGRKDTGSYFVAIKYNKVLNPEFDGQEIIALAIKFNQIEYSDSKFITDIEPISKEEYNMSLPDKK